MILDEIIRSALLLGHKSVFGLRFKALCVNKVLGAAGQMSAHEMGVLAGWNIKLSGVVMDVLEHGAKKQFKRRSFSGLM